VRFDVKGNKRKLSLRYRVSQLEASMNYVMQSIDSLIKTTAVLGSTFEEYVKMKEDTDTFVKHLEKVIKDENKSSETGKEKPTKRSGASKTSGKSS
jgi:uncharacterized protein (UPF0305 family)